ncbi:neprilysin-2-like [Aphidius gifuensis]|uniref:neprilysin-2-like n=1 Tax=Aphidius gifuensis TaxID=684658 RepID=UPI001CDB97B0|nr:neprilysin-2-like [Aphidius gifuensis]
MKAIEHWPVLKGSKWNESTFDFRESMFKVGNTTQWKNYLFRFYYTYDGSIAVEPYSTELSPEDLVQGLNNTKVNEYYNSMFNFAELINASVHNTNYTDDLKKILDFEIELARARLLPVQNLNLTFDEVQMTLDATWIDNSTKTNIFEELMSFQHKIGDINIFTDNLGTNKFYENLELLDDENFNDAIQWIKLFEEKIRFTSGFGFFMNSIALYLYQSEAFFLQNFNLMMLQSDFFDIEQPNYMNYGALGTSIGHEMTHGLDINEINYDANNRWNRVNSHWTSFSKNNFHNKSKCIIEQYNNFTVPEVGLNVNGTLTQGETVADNGGVKAAYRAYKELLNNDKKLPGLNYSPEQLFWISYGNSWCEKNSTEVLRIQLSRVHPPSKFRVIGALSNMPEFAKDFNCPSGSNMNPNKKFIT